MQHMMNTIIQYYHMQHFEGTYDNATDIPQPLPPLNDPTYHLRRPKTNPLGPIGLALHTLFHFGAAMDTELWIHTKNELPIDVLGLPHQMLDPILQATAARARTRAATTRTSHEGLNEVDTHVWKKARKGLSAIADRNLATSLVAGGV